MEQHALGRIDAQPGEQLRIAQRQLDHLAKLADGVLHPADIVVIHHRARVGHFLELGAQLHLGVLVDMDDALGGGRDDAQTDLRQRVGRLVEHPLHLRRHVLHRLLPGGGDQIARQQRLPEEVALQRLGRPLQPHLACGRREDDAGGGARLACPDRDVLARAGLGIGALQPVEPDDVERLVLGIGGHRDRYRRALALDFDHVAFGDAELLEGAARHARDALPALLLPRRRDLQFHRALGHRRVCVRHAFSVA